MVIWRLDRWGRSLRYLVVTLRELTDLGVGFVSLTEALDLTTPTGRAMAGMVAVFAEFQRAILGSAPAQDRANEPLPARTTPKIARTSVRRLLTAF